MVLSPRLSAQREKASPSAASHPPVGEGPPAAVAPQTQTLVSRCSPGRLGRAPPGAGVWARVSRHGGAAILGQGPGLSLSIGRWGARGRSSLPFGSLLVPIFIRMECYEACVMPTLLKFKTFGFIRVRLLVSLLKLDISPCIFLFFLPHASNVTSTERVFLHYCQPQPALWEVCVD